jgi:hypothetical protein
MMMNTPVPFGKSTLDNSPLLATGADFPCKQRSGVYDAEGASNTMALGSTQKLAFTGGATHGGGSCQVSITYDKAPTTSSTWKVIHSIEGGCPIKGVAGNNGASASDVDPDTYSFTVPTSLPTGTAVLAWTWFNKVGNREMYMNCAPITLTASSSKRSEDDLTDGNYTMLMERDTTAYNALPDMFTANINNGCATISDTDLLFPNPGDSVEQDGLATSSALSKPSGSACGAVVSGASATAGASSPSSAAAAATTSAPAQASEASASGGVFITVSPASSAVVATASPVASSATIATVAPVSIASVATSVSVASTPVAASSTPASTGTSTGTSGSGSAIAAGTACTTEGEWNCIGGTSFQQCASGTWSVVQELAAGTSCTAGEATNINIVAGRKDKRSVRFSSSHLRRHIHKY